MNSQNAVENNKGATMPGNIFDPAPEQQYVVLVDQRTLGKAVKLIKSCERCNPEGAHILFDVILDRVTGRASVTDYVPVRPAKCPRCFRPITEHTLIEPVIDRAAVLSVSRAAYRLLASNPLGVANIPYSFSLSRTTLIR